MGEGGEGGMGLSWSSLFGICHGGDGGICSGRGSGADSCPDGDMGSVDMWPGADCSGTVSSSGTSIDTTPVAFVAQGAGASSFLGMAVLAG